MDLLSIALWLFATIAALLAYIHIHELGHAIAALAFTQGDVHICIGPIRGYKQLPSIRFNRLNIVYTRNPLWWYRGSCGSKDEGISFKKRITIIVAGPFVAFVVGAFLWYLTPERRAIPMLDTFVIQFAIFSIIGMVALAPARLSPRRLRVDTGNRDGTLIAVLLRRRSYYPAWATAANHYHQKNYAAAADGFDYILRHHAQDEETYQYAISAHLLARNYLRSDELCAEFEKMYTMTPLDLNNRGYTFNLLGRYTEAIEDFDRAIRDEPRFAFAYNNRGFAKIAMGRLEEGREDIEQSLRLDGRNSYAFRNLGIYHMEQGQFSQALELFEKARTIDASTDEIEDYIARARIRMANERATEKSL